jgi:hypothetical protein
MSGRKVWVAVALAFILGAGIALTATRLLSGPPATSVDPIRLHPPSNSSEDGEQDGKKDGKKKNKKKREKGKGERSGTSEQPPSGGAPPAPPAPPAPAGDDDDDDDDTDDDDDDDTDDSDD